MLKPLDLFAVFCYMIGWAETQTVTNDRLTSRKEKEFETGQTQRLQLCFLLMRKTQQNTCFC